MGQGTFCRVFAATDLVTNQQVALKIEKEGFKKHMLIWENQILENVQGQNYVPKHLEFMGNPNNHSPQVLVMELLHTNISSLRKLQPGLSLSLSLSLIRIPNDKSNNS